eukprot:31327-Pelagococcus_subviridis.AAC.5
MHADAVGYEPSQLVPDRGVELKPAHLLRDRGFLVPGERDRRAQILRALVGGALRTIPHKKCSPVGQLKRDAIKC